MKVTGVRACDDATWDAAWSACPTSTYFESRTWSALWCALDSTHRAAPLAITFEDGSEAVIPRTTIAGRWGLPPTTRMSPAFTYGSLLAADVTAERLVAALEAVRGLTHDVVARHNPLVPPLALPQGWETRPDSTYLLDLEGRSPAELRRNWSKGHRAAVTRATREGVTYRDARGLDDWRGYHAVYLDTVRRWGDRARHVYPLALFEALADVRGDVTLRLAEYQGHIVAGAVLLTSRRHVSYWHGAALESALTAQPVHGLIADAVLGAAKDGRRWFDFNPSGGLTSVERFKRGFGAEEVGTPLYVATGRRRRAVGLLRNALRALSVRNI